MPNKYKSMSFNFRREKKITVFHTGQQHTTFLIWSENKFWLFDIVRKIFNFPLFFFFITFPVSRLLTAMSGAYIPNRPRQAIQPISVFDSKHTRHSHLHWLSYILTAVILFPSLFGSYFKYWLISFVCVFFVRLAVARKSSNCRKTTVQFNWWQRHFTLVHTFSCVSAIV